MMFTLRNTDTVYLTIHTISSDHIVVRHPPSHIGGTISRVLAPFFHGTNHGFRSGVSGQKTPSGGLPGLWPSEQEATQGAARATAPTRSLAPAARRGLACGGAGDWRKRRKVAKTWGGGSRPGDGISPALT